jgi:hypothetical protein
MRNRSFATFGGMGEGFAMWTTVFLAEDTSVFFKEVVSTIRDEKNLARITNSESGLSPLDSIIRHRPDIYVYDIDRNGEKNGFPLLRENLLRNK